MEWITPSHGMQGCEKKRKAETAVPDTKRPGRQGQGHHSMLLDSGQGAASVAIW